MSRPPMKALEQIKNYCEKTQCRRCVFGEKAEMLSDDLDYVGCKLQQECPCEWKIEEGAQGMKLIIDIPEEVYKNIMNDHGVSPYGMVFHSIQNGTPIPDNATNMEVIRAVFKPNHVERTDDNTIVENYDFNKEWLNAPYQKGGNSEYLGGELYQGEFENRQKGDKE